jgi:hypothetical protein
MAPNSGDDSTSAVARGLSIPAHLDALRLVISDPRLNNYRASPEEHEIDLLARYVWNVALSEAFHPTLHCVEIALRNTMHNTLSAAHGAQWYDVTGVLIEHWALDEVKKAKQKLTGMNRPHDPGRVVAELDFGFWTSLLSKRYARSSATPSTQHPLWPILIAAAFPNMLQAQRNPSSGRGRLSARYIDIR